MAKWRTLFSDAMAKRRGLTARTRYLVMQRDGFRCKLCGQCAADGVTLRVDHRKPVALGGTDDSTNLWTLCFPCNAGKAALELDDTAPPMPEAIEEIEKRRTAKRRMKEFVLELRWAARWIYMWEHSDAENQDIAKKRGFPNPNFKVPPSLLWDLPMINWKQERELYLERYPTLREDYEAAFPSR